MDPAEPCRTPRQSLPSAYWPRLAAPSILTWLLHSDFRAARNLLCQLVPGVVGAQQPLFHMAVVAAAVADLSSLDSEAEQTPRHVPLKLQPGSQALLLGVGAVLKGGVVGGFEDEFAVGVRGLVDVPEHGEVGVLAGLGLD